MYIYINVLHINSKCVKCDYVMSNILFINTKKISETLICIFEYVHACAVVLLYSNIKDFLLKHTCIKDNKLFLLFMFRISLHHYHTYLREIVYNIHENTDLASMTLKKTCN